MNNNHKLWVEKYRPTTLQEYVFHDDSHRESIERMVRDKTIPHLLFSGVQGTGKAQPLSSKIVTPTGWKTMGDMEIGAEIITPLGNISSVIEVYPQGKKDIYTITFHDGSSTECCLDHLWECYFVDNFTNRKASKHVIDTKAIIQILDNQQQSSMKFDVSIPMTTAVAFPATSQQIDPYIMGVLLGDGYLGERITRLTTADLQIINECRSRLLFGYEFKQMKNTTIGYSLINTDRINFGGNVGIEENQYTAYFRSVGLNQKRSHEKFIPNEYKTGSIDQRWSVIQGLMDTDGTISKKGNNVSYTTTSNTMAHEVQEILWSLGCTCTITTRTPTYKYKGKKKEGKLSYVLHINHNNGTSQFFLLDRKRKLGTTTFAENHSRGDITLRRRIISIDYKTTEEAQCIRIADDNHLYITDDYIVTHNTALAKVIINELEVEDIDLLELNASNENSVEVMRDKIMNFVRTYAFGDFKVVLLDEADYLTHNSQAVMRNMMEEYADEARFILTCNYENKIGPAIKSRCQHFRFSKGDKDQITEYVAEILIKEKIKWDIDLVDQYVSTGYPDVRKIINLIQQNSNNGVLRPLETGTSEGDYKFELLDLITSDDWSGARKICTANVAQGEWEDLYRFLYDNLHTSSKFKNPDKWEEGIVIIADYLYKHGICADGEVNAAAMFINLSRV